MLGDESAELFDKFNQEIRLQPIEFTAAGFYTINLTFLACVRRNNLKTVIRLSNSIRFRSLLASRLTKSFCCNFM